MPKKKQIRKIPTYRIELVRDGYIEERMVLSPYSVQQTLKAIKAFKRSDREQFVALYLDARNRVIAHHVVSVGTTNSNLVHPREVFKIAIIKNACGVVVAHNHPSGGTGPSEADIELTKRLKQAGKLLGIDLIDHVIIAPDGNFKSAL